MEGWIKLHRELIDSACFADPSTLKLWIYLLLRAATKRQHIPVKNGLGTITVTLNPGEILVGRKRLADELEMPESTAWRKLLQLEKFGNITVKVNNQFSVVTICNWATYQDRKSDSEQRMDNQRTANEQRMNNEWTTNGHIQEREERKELEERKEYTEKGDGLKKPEIHNLEKKETTPNPLLDSFDIGMEDLDRVFIALVDAYPDSLNRTSGTAKAAFYNLIREGHEVSGIVKQAQEFAKLHALLKTDRTKITQLRNWLTTGAWRDDWAAEYGRAAENASVKPADAKNGYSKEVTDAVIAEHLAKKQAEKSKNA